MKQFLVMTLVTLAGLTGAVESEHLFGVGGKPVLCVSESEMDRLLLRYADESIDLRPGGGRTPGFAFLFDSSVMVSTFHGYNIKEGFESHPYVNPLSGSVEFLGADDEHRLGPAMRSRNTEDEWYARNECPRPDVKWLPDAKLYQVKCSGEADYGSLWDRAPAHQSAMPDPNSFVVATCKFETINVGPYHGKSLRTCSHITVIDGFLLDYRIQEENSRFIREIDTMLRRKIAEWKQRCHTSLEYYWLSPFPSPGDQKA